MLVALLVALAFGACAGSFLGVVIHRLPRGISIVHPPSRCGVCGTRLAWYENIPILGWFALKGRCRHCGTPIPVSCIWMEAVVALITAVVTWGAMTQPQLWSQAVIAWNLKLDMALGIPFTPMFSWSHPYDGLWLAQGVTLAVLLPVTWLLIAAFVIDWELMIIPDEITKGLQVVAIPLAALVGTNQIWSPSHDHPWALKWWLQTWDRIDGMIATPGNAALRLGVVAAIGCALILASLPLARWIYARFDPRDAWSDDDRRAFTAGAAWFCIWLAVWAGLGVLLIMGHPPGILETEAEANPWFRFDIALCNAVLGALVGWMLPWGIALVGTIGFKRSAMGYADVKLLGALGAFLGPFGLLAAFACATLVGSAVGIPARFFGGGRQIPFGPYLAAGAVVAVGVGPWLAPLAGRLFHGMFV